MKSSLKERPSSNQLDKLLNDRLSIISKLQTNQKEIMRIQDKLIGLANGCSKSRQDSLIRKDSKNEEKRAKSFS